MDPTFEFIALLPSTVLNMKTIVCLAAFVAVSAAFLPPPPPPPHYRPHGFPRPPPLGCAMDPTTLLLLNKNGGLGSGSNNLLPLLLLGGGGVCCCVSSLFTSATTSTSLSPTWLSTTISVGGCKEEHSPCTKIADANADATKKCGLDTGTSCN